MLSMLVEKGIDLDLSEKLTDTEKATLLKFIARISEVSYRRGYQQAYTATQRDTITIDPVILRYDRDIDQAPHGENGEDSGRTAIDILHTEYYAAINKIGLI